MKYLIVLCDINLDSIVSMYLYCKLIQNAGFDVRCYISDDKEKEVRNIMKKNNIKFDITNIIDEESNIIILNNGKFNVLDSIDIEKVTEIISLKNSNFNKFVDANILIDNVRLLSTIIIERYREYKLDFSNEMCSLIVSLYNNYTNLTKRDNIAKDYIKILYDNNL